MQRWVLRTLPLVGIVLATIGIAFAARDGGQVTAQDFDTRVHVPAVASDGPLPEPTPTPVPDHGPVVAVYIRSIGVDDRWPIERLDTVLVNGEEQFANPVNPQAIVHYPAFGVPGRPGHNSTFAGHVNFHTGIATPFARIQQARPGSDVYVEMEDGTIFHYTLKSNETIPLSSLENGGMQSVVYPSLPANRERVTFISCGGDFVGGSYNSRVILTAERIID